jgi:hypothetical protein
MENRIQINGVWYVAETTPSQPEVTTVNWLISKLQDLVEQGCGDYKVTIDVDWGNDYGPIDDIYIMEEGRVHIR